MTGRERTDMHVPLFRPPGPQDLSALDVERYFANVLTEWEKVPFNAEERKLLREVMFGKYLDRKARRFFLYHFTPLVQKAVCVFFESCQKPFILELGCGSGSLSILFAILGAKVIGVDLNPDLISACRKRQVFYEAHVGNLELEFHCADVFVFPYDRIGAVDGIYSLFAFNMMQPSQKLLARVVPVLRQGGKIVVSDGNRRSIYNRLFRKRDVLAPGQMRVELVANGCRVIELKCGGVISPALARIGPIFNLLLKLENRMKHLGILPWLGI